MIGEYLASLFEEVKDRPLYLIYKSYGINEEKQPIPKE